MTTETTREPMMVRPELIAAIEPKNKALAQIILEASVELDGADDHSTFEKNAVLGAVDRIRDVIRREIETDRAHVLIANNGSFQRLLRGLHTQGLLNADTLCGAFAAEYCCGQEIQDVSDPVDTVLSRIDWPDLVAWANDQIGERSRWAVILRGHTARRRFDPIDNEDVPF